jgi:dihydrodipicolinate synthase/N-acetylneuraminate lyase
MTAPLFAGAGVALLSLFDADGTLLIDETAQFAATLAADGAAGILVAGTTGEFWTLTEAERLGLIAAVRAAVPEHVPVLAGIGALDAARALRLASDVVATGADAALCFTPRDESPAPFYAKVRDAVGGLPLLAYHFPAAGYEPLAVDDLSTFGIDGIKDSSGDPGRLVATARVLPAGVYTGSALLATLAAATGIAGVLLALGNVAPDAAAAAVTGDLDGQRELVRLHSLLTGAAPPAPLKRLAAQRYGTPTSVRSPALADAT